MEIPNINNKVIFMPFQGEFGWFILYMRLIYCHKCEEKVVCCKKGDELFFPNAHKFIYDYPLVTSPDRVKRGARMLPEEYEFKEQFKKQYPEYFIHHASDPWPTHFTKVPVFDFDPQRHYNLKCDMVLGPRLRERGRKKNWGYWQYLIDRLIADGFTVGVTGRKDTTYNLKGVINSWDYENNNSASVEMLQTCKVFCGVTSGTSMLAAACKTPTLLLVASNDLYVYNMLNKDVVMKSVDDFHNHSKRHPEIVYDNLISFYKERLNGI